MGWGDHRADGLIILSLAFFAYMFVEDDRKETAV